MNNSERSTPPRLSWRTIPNLVTALRIALVAPIVALLLSGAQPLGAAALAAVFAATDWIDGWLARRLRQVSHAGTILDPLADRLGVTCIAAALASAEAVPWWMIAVFPAVDLLVFGVFLARRDRSLSVTLIGKVRTGIAMVSVLVVIIGMTPGLDLVLAVGQAGLAFGAALHAAVGVDYLRQLLGPSVTASVCGPKNAMTDRTPNPK